MNGNYVIVSFAPKNISRSKKMKINIRILMIMTALGVVFVFASNSFAQTANVPQVGGFKSVSVTDKQVVAAADFAIEQIVEKSKMDVELDLIKKAEYQVVAGKNFRLCMQIKVYPTEEEANAGAEAETGFLSATVFQNLKGAYSLTKATVVENCGK